MANLARKNAASYMALIEYRFHLLAIVVAVAAMFYFGVAIEEKRNFLTAIGAVFIGLVAAWLARDFLFSKLMLQKYEDDQLRRMWLRFGGFDEDQEQ